MCLAHFLDVLLQCGAGVEPLALARDAEGDEAPVHLGFSVVAAGLDGEDFVRAQGAHAGVQVLGGADLHHGAAAYVVDDAGGGVVLAVRGAEEAWDVLGGRVL